ncbi:Hypothetical protein R9X50_00491900 [Acrodontium crateriforme]|uniref:Uncharacterized protein n=1 Tax=Acrodontium crateriforme TaxID=150365 RepID=A0AAQ3M665_9PEZI|nr:Hypothetical protein R9X50_00491900 [Acrodontium crateriforme]
MAHLLLQQRPNVEAHIRVLINADLKEICKAYNVQVSGTKAVLQKRCLDILDGLVQRGDTNGFNDFAYRASHNGRPRTETNTTSRSTNGSSNPGSWNGAAINGAKPASTKGLPVGGKYFKSSPFYEVLETVLPLQDLAEMPQNRNTVRTQLRLSEAVTQQLKSDKSLRLLVYCGLTQGMAPYSPVDVAFPNQLEVKINDDDVKHNFKGLKNKVGTTKPADITDKCRLIANYSNQIAVTYALTTKRYAYTVHLARYISSDKLVNIIKTAKVIPKQTVLDEMNKANADPDIAATAIRMSLKDPVSTIRITLPIRSTICSHNQCFDGAMFLQLQEQAPQWQCPICNKSITFASLCVDKYFEDILERTPKSIEKVDIEPNGEWKMIKLEEEPRQNGGGKQARAAYDHDDDDDDDDEDLVEITDGHSRVSNGTGVQSQATSHYSPVVSTGPSSFTPRFVSREPSIAQSTSTVGNKRSAEAVIDLTLSDDDEPPRPVKRVAPSQPQPTVSSANVHGVALPRSATSFSLSYNNPTPAAERPTSRPAAANQAENHRTFSSMGRLPGLGSNASFGFQRPVENPRSSLPPSQSPVAGPTQPSFGVSGFHPQSQPSSSPPAEHGVHQQLQQLPQDSSLRLPPIHSPWRGDRPHYSSSSSPPG